MRAWKVSYSDVGEEGVAVNCEKKFFLNTLYKYGMLDSFGSIIEPGTNTYVPAPVTSDSVYHQSLRGRRLIIFMSLESYTPNPVLLKATRK